MPTIDYIGGDEVTFGQASTAMMLGGIIAWAEPTRDCAWYLWLLGDGRQVEFCSGGNDYPDTWKIATV